MDSGRRSSYAAGMVLILLGVCFIVFQLVPGLRDWFSWPLLVIGAGLFLLLFGLLAGEPGMAVPACIVGGIGVLLTWQNATGNWESWTYAWTLIPGFVGLGIVVSGLLGENTRDSVFGGGFLILISLVLFAIFGSQFGELDFLGDYWPALLILLGFLLLIRNLFLLGRR